MMYYNAGLDLPRHFGQCLKYEREKRKWSQEYFAERVGVDPRTVRRWEAEGITKVDILTDIASAFDSNWGDVFSDREDIPHFKKIRKNPYGRTNHVLVIGVLFRLYLVSERRRQKKRETGHTAPVRSVQASSKL